MKKTIISLLVLAGVAAAADVVSWDATAGDASLVASGTSVQTWDVRDSGLTWNKNVAESLILTVDVDSFAAGNAYTLLTFKDQSYNGLSDIYVNDSSLCLYMWNGTEPSASVGLAEVVGLGTETLTLVWNRTASNTVVLDVYADDHFDAVVWTTTYTSTGANGVSFGDNPFHELNFGGKTVDLTGNGNTVVPSGAGAGEWTLLGAGYTAGSLVTAEQLSGYYAANVGTLVNPAAALAVPEPATATLSLLALCGLAARRRR